MGYQKHNKLFVASENERNILRMKQQYEKAPDPSKLVLLPGNAHAQHIFKTDQSDHLTNLILEFLVNGKESRSRVRHPDQDGGTLRNQ